MVRSGDRCLSKAWKEAAKAKKVWMRPEVPGTIWEKEEEEPPEPPDLQKPPDILEKAPDRSPAMNMLEGGKLKE